MKLEEIKTVPVCSETSDVVAEVVAGVVSDPEIDDSPTTDEASL